MNFQIRCAFVAASALAIVGCATLPPDRGYADVRERANERGVSLPDTPDADPSQLIDAALAQPLTLDGAVRIAFVNNPRVLAEYARLGLSAADAVQAGRLSNPTLAATWQTSSRSADADRYSVGLTQNFAELLLLGARARFGKAEFERAKLDATQRLLDLAAQVQTAYYAVVGAQHVARMRAAIANAANASAELAARFNSAGNTSALELAIERVAASQAQLDAEQADAQVAAARNTLNALMGLTAGARWSIDAQLPAPILEEDSLDSLQSLANEKRADLDSDRRAVVLLEDALGLARSFRYVGDIEVGAQYERDTDRNRLIGPSLSIQLPIFNQGQAAVLRAESLLDRARAQARATELDVSNAVFAAHARLMAMRQRAERLKTDMIPLREQILERTQKKVNYQLVGVFDLLRAQQDEYAAYQQYLEAVRDYWIARVDLAHAVGSALPSDRLIGAAVVTYQGDSR